MDLSTFFLVYGKDFPIAFTFLHFLFTMKVKNYTTCFGISVLVSIERSFLGQGDKNVEPMPDHGTAQAMRNLSPNCLLGTKTLHMLGGYKIEAAFMLG